MAIGSYAPPCLRCMGCAMARETEPLLGAATSTTRRAHFVDSASDDDYWESGSLTEPTYRFVPSSHQASQDASNHSLVTGTDTTYDRSNLTPEVPSSIGFSDNIRTECSTPSAVLESETVNENRSMDNFAKSSNHESPLSTGEKKVLFDCSSKTKKAAVVFSSAMILCLILSLAVLIPLALLPSTTHGSVEVYNFNNDTVKAAKFNRKKYNKITLKHDYEEGVDIRMTHVFSERCKSLETLNTTHRLAINHSLTFSEYAPTMAPTYFLPGSRIQFNFTVLNVSTIAVQIYLYIFNDLNLYGNYFEKENLPKNIFKSQVYTFGSGPQSTNTTILYNVSNEGYLFAAVITDSLIDLTYSSSLVVVSYDTSRLTENCVITDDDSCEIDYSFTFTQTEECILCYVTVVPSTTASVTHITNIVSKKGYPPYFYIVLGVQIGSSVIVLCAIILVYVLTKCSKLTL